MVSEFLAQHRRRAKLKSVTATSFHTLKAGKLNISLKNIFFFFYSTIENKQNECLKIAFYVDVYVFFPSFHDFEGRQLENKAGKVWI